MAKNKTTETESSVTDFINNFVDNEAKRNDAFELIEIMNKVTGFEPKMWGPSIIGFGSYHYKYESGRAGDAPLAGFSPRKDNFALYFSSDFEDKDQLLANLGKHKTGKACVYIKKLDEINIDILKQMIINSIASLKSQYG